MRGRDAKQIGLAIVGGGRVGLFRGEVAARHPSVGWIGLAEKNPNRAGEVASRIGVDFVTQDHRELLARPEVTAAIIATDEHLHVAPILAAVERGVPLLIEKPLATDLAQSTAVLQAIERAGLDAVVGYTQRFRRKWLSAKEKVRTGALGDVTPVTSRACMNRLVAIDNYKRADNPAGISPMVISGTHALDIVMWCMEEKTPVEVSKVKSRMPTRRENGEGCTEGEESARAPVRSAGIMGTARLEGDPGNRGRPAAARVTSSNADIWRRLRRESDRGIVPLKPGNSGGGKAPDFWCAFDVREDRVIGDEPVNTG